MYKRYVILVLLPLAGCAATQEPQTALAVDGGLHIDSAPTASIAATAAETVNLREFDQRTVCETITRPGSRLVVDRRCYTPDANPDDQRMQDEMVRLQMDELQRLQRQQEQMELERQREMERRRAILMQQQMGR